MNVKGNPMAKQLKPCPFCNNDNPFELLATEHSDGYFRVDCQNCGCHGPAYSDKDDALKKWNTRNSNG